MFAELELSWSCHAICQIALSKHFPDLSLVFSLIETEISEQGSRQVATEEPKKGLKTCQAP